MTKRYGSYQANNNKKAKLDEDDIWGDELDDEALNRCFELATQVCAEEVASSQSVNVSILPTYSVFKNPNALTSSTQSNNSCIASTSKQVSINELEIEINRLKQQNEEKEGEIAILRTRIRENASTVQVEQRRTTNEWREKLQTTQRELQMVKSDLEFKNLEIANLKQQLVEGRRISNINNTLSCTQQFVVQHPVVKVNHERPKISKKNLIEQKPSFREAILETIYPLKSILPETFSNLTDESHTIKYTACKSSRNTIPYLQNQVICNEKNFNHKCIRLGNRKITPQNVYPEVFKLANSSLEELKSSECQEAIDKLICVTLILLNDLNEYLAELGSHLRTEDIQQADVSYLTNEVQLNFSLRSQNVQLGVQAAKLLFVIAELVSYSVYTAEFICCNANLKLSPKTREYAMLIPHKNGVMQNDYYLLTLLLTILGRIGKYRLAKQTNNLLLSILKLLENISLLNKSDYMEELTAGNELFCKLFKALVFARPGHEVVEKLTFLLKSSSSFKHFLQFLFRKNERNELLKSGPKGILYYNEEACSFCVLAILLQNYALQTELMPLEVCYNMISFIYNSFKTSHWIHHETGEKVCACLSQLYKLEIDFIFRGISEFIKHYCRNDNKSYIPEEWMQFLKNGIVQKVLNQMNFNNFDLTEKYVMVFSQFKEIEKTLKSQGLFIIDQMNISEDMPRIASNKINRDF